MMQDSTELLFTAWEFRPLLFFSLLLLGVVYTLGWIRLRRRSQRNNLARPWRLVFYWLSLILIVISLMSPVDTLGGFLFYMHMIQHLLLTMFAAPLLLLADPMPFLMWGLPTRQRRWVGKQLSRALNKESAFRRNLRAITTPGICWVIMVVLLWGWHDPDLYNAALRDPFVHDLEHLSFFYSALVYWWHVTGAGPHIHPSLSRPFRIGYLLAGVPATMGPGITIAFSNRILYTYYEAIPRLGPPLGLSVANDQTLGGIIMWAPGSMMFVIGALVVIARWLQEEERKRPLRQREYLEREITHDA